MKGHLQTSPQPKSSKRRALCVLLSLITGISAGNWLLGNDADRVTALDLPAAQVAEGYAQLEAGDSEQALQSFESALREDHCNLSALLGQAMIYSERQQHAAAFSAYNTIVETFPQHAFAWNRRGLAAFNLEDFDEALRSFERATESQPVNGFFYESLAWVHLCRGEFPAAAESAKTASLMYNRAGESTLYPLLITYFAYLESGADLNAQRTLSYALQNRPGAWPTPVVDYLAGQMDASELISQVTNSAEETEAHTYIGLRLKSLGEAERSRRHLSWVARRGDPRVFEYTLARSLNLQLSIASVER